MYTGHCPASHYYSSAQVSEPGGLEQTPLKAFNIFQFKGVSNDTFLVSHHQLASSSPASKSQIGIANCTHLFLINVLLWNIQSCLKVFQNNAEPELRSAQKGHYVSFVFLQSRASLLCCSFTLSRSLQQVLRVLYNQAPGGAGALGIHLKSTLFFFLFFIKPLSLLLICLSNTSSI